MNPRGGNVRLAAEGLAIDDKEELAREHAKVNPPPSSSDPGVRGLLSEGLQHDRLERALDLLLAVA